MNRQIKHSLLLVLTAVIWGSSFVAQSTGGDAIGPFAFNGIRSFIGSVVLLPVIFFFDKKGNDKKPITSEAKKRQLKYGIICGIFLFLASTLQQYGITLGTDSGKAGFITTFYILLVPVFSLFLKKKSPLNVWIATIIALFALYLLCMNSEFYIAPSDIFVMLCAVAFAIHILFVDRFSPETDGVRLSCIQFCTCGVLSVIPAICFDIVPVGISTWSGYFLTTGTAVSLFYSGVMSCGVAYTLQIIGQNGLNPTIASLIMSMESVFAVLSGWLILNEHLSTREKIGCILMFAAIIISQLPIDKIIQKHIKQKA